MIRHMVHLRYRSSVTSAEKLTLYARLAALSGHLSGINDFQHRTNTSPETQLVRGFADMFWFDFSDVAGRDAYLDDPVHQAIGADLVAKLEGGADGVFVCDIEI